MSINNDGAEPDNSAMLDVSDTTRGFLMPRMTAAQMNAITSPAEGLIIYNTTDSAFFYFDGNNWLNSGSSGQNLDFTSPMVNISGGSSADITGILYKEHRLPDTLGIHLMTGNMVTNGNWINGDEDDEGIFVNFGGQVGIGNNSPTQLLDVSGIAEIDSLRINNSYGLPTSDGTSGYVLQTDGSGNVTWESAGSGTSPWTNSGTDTYLSSGDNVGIGTNSPNADYSLELNSTGGGGNRGGLYIENDVNGNIVKEGIRINITDNGNEKKYGTITEIVGKNNQPDSLFGHSVAITPDDDATTPYAFAFKSKFVGTDGTTYGIYTENEDYNYFSGNVGIGTSTPTQSIDIVGVAEIDSLRINNSYGLPTSDGTSGYVLQTDGSGNVTWESVGDDDLGNHTATQNIELDGNFISNDGGNEGLSIANNGNTTITGTSGGQVLTVNGFYRTSGQGSGIEFTNNQISITGNNGNTGDMIFETGSNDRMRLTGSGDLGIGTTNPSAKLDVVGDIEIPAANDYTYASAQTRYLSIAPAGFNFAGPDTGSYCYQADEIPFWRSVNGGNSAADASLTSNVYLPDGAVVTNIDFYVYDNSSTYEVKGYMAFYTIGTLASFVNMALTSGTGTTAASTSLQTLSDNTIANATIDNANRAYFIRFETKENNTDLRIYGARITYTVQKTD